jgi:hypothetical protein
MGYKIEINWVLKLPSHQIFQDKESLKEGEIYEFEKAEERLYPLNLPIELVNENWEILAEISIVEITISNGKTKGKYKVLALPPTTRKSLYYKYF